MNPGPFPALWKKDEELENLQKIIDDQEDEIVDLRDMVENQRDAIEELRDKIEELSSKTDTIRNGSIIEPEFPFFVELFPSNYLIELRILL